MSENKYLKDWENDINRFIRCAFCFEGCIIFIDIIWWTDEILGKAILLYSLLRGQFKPSKFIADKCMNQELDTSIECLLLLCPSNKINSKNASNRNIGKLESKNVLDLLWDAI